jgi:chromate reductase
VRILAISGSLRAGSHNTRLLRAAEELLDARGADVLEFDALRAVPPYDEDDDREPAPPAVATFRDAIAGADGVVIATPEYNSSIPGQLKNALDWASRPIATNVFRNKPVAVIGASTGMFGAVWAQAELRKVLAAMGARVVEGELPVGHAHTRFDQEGRLTDDDVREKLGTILDTLVTEVRPQPEREPQRLSQVA